MYRTITIIMAIIYPVFMGISTGGFKYINETHRTGNNAVIYIKRKTRKKLIREETEAGIKFGLFHFLYSYMIETIAFLFYQSHGLNLFAHGIDAWSLYMSWFFQTMLINVYLDVTYDNNAEHNSNYAMKPKLVIMALILLALISSFNIVCTELVV